MDPLAVAVGTALVSAMVTDAWQQSRAGVVALWRRFHPQIAESISTELEEARLQLLASRDQTDNGAQEAQASLWGRRVQQMIDDAPTSQPELRGLLEALLSMPSEEDVSTSVIQRAVVSGGQSIQVGRDFYGLPPQR